MRLWTAASIPCWRCEFLKLHISTWCATSTKPKHGQILVKTYFHLYNSYRDFSKHFWSTFLYKYATIRKTKRYLLMLRSRQSLNTCHDVKTYQPKFQQSTTNVLIITVAYSRTWLTLLLPGGFPATISTVTLCLAEILMLVQKVDTARGLLAIG